MIVFCDGASNPKTKRSGIGCVWFNREQFHNPNDAKTILPGAQPQFVLSKEIFGSDTKYIYPTNNEAEYISLINALRVSLEKGIEEVDIYMDSKLVVYQVKGAWKINFDHLRRLKSEVDAYRDKIKFRVFHIRREFNTQADKASKECISKPPPNPFKEWKV